MDVTSTPDAAPRKEGLLASAYRFMTAPFLVRTPSNVTTHNKCKKSSPTKLVCIDNSASTGIPNVSPEAENVVKVPSSQEMIGLNARCEKATMKEVKFFIHSYKEFMTSNNKKLQSVIDALNAANVGRYNNFKIQYPSFTWDPPLIDIRTLVTLVQQVYPAQVVKHTLGSGKKSTMDTENAVKPKAEEPAGLFPLTKQRINNEYKKNFRDFNEEELINEVLDDNKGSYQPSHKDGHDYRSKSRSPDVNSYRERNRYDTMDRRYRHDSHASRSDNSYNNQLTSSQRLEVKLQCKAQCKEAAEKMKTSEVMIAWSKLAGHADRIMREETRQHEGILTWELFQSTLIEHFYHIPSKERTASLLNKLQQDPHESIGEYVQRSSKIIQVHSGKTNLKEIAASQYGWNLVQGLTNISIKNKIADRISQCQSLSDVCKLVKQVKREMENREAFTGISVESEENIEEVNWKQHNFTQRGRGNNRGNYRGNYYNANYNSRGKNYKSNYNSGYGNSSQQAKNNYQTRRLGNTTDIQCLLCGLKGHKVTTCRKLTRAQDLIKQDKQHYWDKRRGHTKKNTTHNNTKHQQINEVDDNTPIDEVESQEEEIYDQDYDEMDDIAFPISDLTEEEDEAYYYDN